MFVPRVLLVALLISICGVPVAAQTLAQKSPVLQLLPTRLRMLGQAFALTNFNCHRIPTKPIRGTSFRHLRFERLFSQATPHVIPFEPIALLATTQSPTRRDLQAIPVANQLLVFV